MNIASKSLVGSHDFAAFAGPNAPIDAPTRRNVEYATSTRNGDNIEFKIIANAYLHQQIRRIAGVLYDVGRGNASPQLVGQLLASEIRGTASYVMPAEGLCLEEISYGGSGECGLPAFSNTDSAGLSVD
jgi:tRNA pseudouridine38-40 synthase